MYQLVIASHRRGALWRLGFLIIDKIARFRTHTSMQVIVTYVIFTYVRMKSSHLKLLSNLCILPQRWRVVGSITIIINAQ